MEEKIKFAVFIDYDNIEIGVKSTLHRDFDVATVLEGLKERGEVVSKVSYGNWSRHGMAARAFSEHGVQMVQRDSTPRGDKNGGDINLALDALEMAFTRDHINAFAIVSGDSDFMPLVNKLKQFNKRVYIVGGKAFTSTILQRNCNEFISYESLLDSQPSRSRRGGQPAQRGRSRHSLPLAQAVPLIDRALHALEIRGVQPQMGLLKSTMLQLDPAFSERDYGTSSFSTFVEKLAAEGFLSIRTVDGHYMVERKGADKEEPSGAANTGDDALVLLGDVLAANRDLLSMGIPGREIRALMRAAHPSFKETEYGFSEFAELLNYAGDKGLVRVEADPQHGLRYYPGQELPQPGEEPATALAARAAKGTEGEAVAESPSTAEAKPVRRAKSRRGRRRKPGTADAAEQPEAEEVDGAEASPAAAAPRTQRTRRKTTSSRSRSRSSRSSNGTPKATKGSDETGE